MATTALTRDQISEKVKLILSQQLNVRIEELLPDASIEGDLGADSLDVMEIVLSFEQEFGITIPDSEIKDLKTVRQAIEYVQGALIRG